jgi:hypothetical protein
MQSFLEPQLGTQICGKSFFSMSFRISCDSKTKIIHTAVATAANASDVCVFHDRRDNKDGHARIIIMHPARENSPLEAGYIFADGFSSNQILLALERRTIQISTTTASEMANADIIS